MLTDRYQAADGEAVVGAEGLDVGLWDYQDSDGFVEGVEDLQDATPGCALWMGHPVHDHGNVAPPEAVFYNVPPKGYALVELRYHERCSLWGLRVTKCTLPSACHRSQMVVTRSDTPFGPVKSPSTRRNSPY